MTASKETIQWAGKRNIPITPGEGAPLEVVQDITRFYATCLAQDGHTLTLDHLVSAASVYIADSREQAFKEAGPYMLYLMHTLLGHGSIRDVGEATQRGWMSESAYDYIRPEHREAFLRSRSGIRQVTLEQLANRGRLCWGTPEEVGEALIARADALGSNTVLLNFNQGAMAHDMFMRNPQTLW